MTINHRIIPALSEKDKERFWSHVSIWWPRACWLWKTGKDKDGYGKFSLSREGDRYTFRAHRIAIFLATGNDPGDLKTCHNCPGGDNPGCCNPAHLWPGTVQDNNADMVKKGRYATGDAHFLRRVAGVRQGEKNQNSKLTDNDVRQIRALFSAGGVTKAALGRKFGIDEVMVGCIIFRRNWKHIA